MANKAYNPDVLNCIANLSNDEVFTPPVLANQMLDMLPQELFGNPSATFLDPFCKSGVFLREIVKRLDRGLARQIPNRQKRIDHIMHHQVYGIALTELTSLLSRRTLYCSRCASSQHSVSYFDDEQGHVFYKAFRHTWVNGKCKYCGASEEVYDRGSESEQYAYQFIHTDNPETLFPKNMKFDVIIGNPPYQMSDGGGAGTSAMPIYQKFVEQAKKLNPRYLSMIIPARWFSGGFGLDVFRKNMISDNKIRVLNDYVNSVDCFGTGVEIKGGVCYFLWDRDHSGECKIITHKDGKTSEASRFLCEDGMEAFIRWNEGISVYHKVKSFGEKTFMDIVSSQKPYGIGTAFHGKKTSNGNDILIYENGGTGYVDKISIVKNYENVGENKVFISAGYNGGDNFPHQILGKPIVAGPNSCCTETYVEVGPVKNKQEAENLAGYMQTKFFRFMVMLLKNTQHALKKVYQLAPQQDWSRGWTDKDLYEKYGLSDDEIDFIESMIKPIGDGGDE